MTDPRIRLLYTRAELIGLGRCADCGWSVPEQGHHSECPARDEGGTDDGIDTRVRFPERP